jgi:hypothetical protein
MPLTSVQPGVMNRCGSRACPTPLGVPVKMMSPDSSSGEFAAARGLYIHADLGVLT